MVYSVPCGKNAPKRKSDPDSDGQIEQRPDSDKDITVKGYVCSLYAVKF